MATRKAKKEHPLTIIGKVVLPLKVDAMDRAEKFAKATVERVRKELAEAGNDLEKAAPYPRSFGMPRHEYESKHSRYSLFQHLCRWRDSTHRPGTPCYADVAVDRVEKFIEDHRKSAAEQYDLFVMKLDHKIGEVTAATLDGNHVWSYSILHVVKADGTEERWKTQQIENRSKLGKYFAQWPTRKLKEHLHCGILGQRGFIAT